MRISALHLAAFGRFSGETLAFAPTSPDFHLVYGANEAGKSTAVEAFRSLLYGVEERTPYGFLHPNPDLRIGGTLVLGGETHEIVRRKGRKNTLQTPAGEPLEEGFLQGLLARLEREQFQRMFALTHGDLVAGGQEIVKGEGSVGRALFSAGLGGVHLGALLHWTQSEAEGLFRPRASKLPLNSKLGDLRELDAALRGLQLSGEAWARQGRELAKAQASLRGLAEQCELLASEQLRLQRLQRTLPALEKLAELEARRAELGEVAALPGDFDQRRREAQQQFAEARRQREVLQQRHRRAQEKADEVETSDEWLRRAGEIDQLHKRLGSHEKGRQDSLKLQTEYGTLETGMRALLARLPGRPELPAALARVPDAGTLAELRRLIEERGGLDQQLRHARRELEDCLQRLAKAREELEQLPTAAEVTGLRRALRAVQRQGDLESDLTAAERAQARALKTAAERLAALTLWQGEFDGALLLPVPLAETVSAYAQRFRAHADAGARLQERAEQGAAEEADLTQQLHTLELAGAVPLEGDLHAARGSRDAGWSLLKRRYLLGEEVDLGGYAPDGDAAAVYEGQVHASDEVADRLWREAQKVEKRASLESELQRVQAERAAAAEALLAHEQQAEALWVQWRGEWEACGLEPLSPEEMREWLRRLSELRAAVEALGERRQAAETVQQAVAAAAAALRAELPLPPAEECPGLSALVERAEATLEEVQQARQAREKLTGAVRDAEADEGRRRRDLAEVEGALTHWGEQWTAATADLDLGEHPAVEPVRTVLEILAQLQAEHEKAEDLQHRLKGIARDAESFRREVNELVAALAPSLAALPPETAARELHAGLQEARKANALLAQLEEEIAGHETDLAAREEEAAEAAGELAELARLAGCEQDRLPDAWAAHLQRQELERTLRETQERLHEGGDGRSLTELHAEAQGRDLDQIRARLDSLGEELQAARAQHDEQQRAVWELEHELAALDGSDAAAVKADQRQALVADIRDDLEHYLVLAVAQQLLSRGIEAYRQANQEPMLARAGELFARMTARAFAGLRLEYGDADDPLLVGVRADGETAVQVGGMSDGTADQLYLALRLAAVEQFCAQAEPLPLLVDDILIRFDDDRARETLRVLGEVSACNQVVFFTHHRRLCQLADEVFGPGGYGLIELPGSPLPAKGAAAGEQPAQEPGAQATN